jgi:hypothetical protein
MRPKERTNLPEICYVAEVPLSLRTSSRTENTNTSIANPALLDARPVVFYTFQGYSRLGNTSIDPKLPIVGPWGDVVGWLTGARLPSQIMSTNRQFKVATTHNKPLDDGKGCRRLAFRGATFFFRLPFHFLLLPPPKGCKVFLASFKA